jgi:multicomponent Na+:H+ antiporter subunit C
MLGIIYRTWVLARQDDIQDDIEDRRVAETPSFDAEDDAVIPVETSEFPLPMRGPDGSAAAEPTATVEAGGRILLAEHAALEEKPGSANITGPDTDTSDGGAK